MNNLFAFLYKHELFGKLKKSLHWSFKKEWTHRGWDYVPNHITKVAE